MSATPRRTTSTRCLTKSEPVPLLRVAGVNAGRPFLPCSGVRPAADIDHVAIAGRGILVDEAGDQHAPVEGDNFSIQVATGWSGRYDIILAALAALQTQFLRSGLVGQMHDHTTGGSGSDHVRLLALPPRRSFGARAVIGILVGGETPAADNFVRANRRRDLGRHIGFWRRRG